MRQKHAEPLRKVLSLVAQIVRNLRAILEAQISFPGSGRSPGEGSGNPLQYSCMGNPMDRGAWGATVQETAKELDTTGRLHFQSLLKTVWRPGILRSRMLTCTRDFSVNPRGSSLGVHVRPSSAWGPCSHNWPPSSPRWIITWSPPLRCSVLLALTCLPASPSHCLSSLTKILPIPGHVLAKTVLIQIFPAACWNPALHPHSPLPSSRYTPRRQCFADSSHSYSWFLLFPRPAHTTTALI